MTEDYVFHYQKRDDGRLIHDVQITFTDIENGDVSGLLSCISDFLKAIGHDFDVIGIRKKKS